MGNCAKTLALIAAAFALMSAQAPAPDPAVGVLAAAREAMGGEKKLAAVRTVLASGRTRQVRGDNLIPIEFEIAIELPDKYVRKDEIPAQDSGPTIAGFRGDEALGRLPSAVVKQDFARLTLGLFAGSFSSYPLTFTYAGKAEAPQGKADVIDVKGPAGPGALAARLFINADTHLPIMISWTAPAQPSRGGPPPASAAAPESRLYFGEYREVSGLQLPFRIRRALGSETVEETTFDGYKINGKIDPKKFEVRK